MWLIFLFYPLELRPSGRLIYQHLHLNIDRRHELLSQYIGNPNHFERWQRSAGLDSTDIEYNRLPALSTLKPYTDLYDAKQYIAELINETFI